MPLCKMELWLLTHEWLYRMLCCNNRLLACPNCCPLQFVLDRSVSADGWQGKTDWGYVLLDHFVDVTRECSSPYSRLCIPPKGMMGECRVLSSFRRLWFLLVRCPLPRDKYASACMPLAIMFTSISLFFETTASSLPRHDHQIVCITVALYWTSLCGI